MGDLGNKWVIRVWVGKHGANGEKNLMDVVSWGSRSRHEVGYTFGDGESRAPLVSEDI
jgi:hypothetical protein